MQSCIESLQLACVCAWTEGLEEDRYALPSSSLASPMRSPQSYSPSVHLHQVKLLFSGFYCVQWGVSIYFLYFINVYFVCMCVLLVWSVTLSRCSLIWQNLIYIWKTPPTTSRVAPLLFIPPSAPLLHLPLHQWFRATILLGWGHLLLYPRTYSPPQPLLQWTPGTQGALYTIIVELEGWTCHIFIQTAIIKPAC